MLTREALGRDRAGDDAGVTLAELLVAMSLLTIFLAVFSSIAVKMFVPVGNQQARSDNLDTARNALQVLDRQVRYADALNPPLTVGGSQYVTLRSQRSTGTGTGSGPTFACYQWRVTGEGLMQYRTWLPAAAVATPGWSTVGTGVGSTDGAPVFTVSTLGAQQLVVSFTSTHGVAGVGTPTVVTFTAVNTRRPPTGGTAAPCQEVAPS